MPLKWPDGATQGPLSWIEPAKLSKTVNPKVTSVSVFSGNRCPHGWKFWLKKSPRWCLHGNTLFQMLLAISIIQRHLKALGGSSFFSFTFRPLQKPLLSPNQGLQFACIPINFFPLLTSPIHVHVIHACMTPPNTFEKPCIKILPPLSPNPKPNNSVPKTLGPVRHIPNLHTHQTYHHTHHLQFISNTIPSTISLSKSSCPPITLHTYTTSIIFGDGNLSLENLPSSTLVISVTLYSFSKASSHLSLTQANPMLSLLGLPNWMVVFRSFLFLMVPCPQGRDTQALKVLIESVGSKML